MKVMRNIRITLLLCFTLMYLTGMAFAQEKEVEVQYQVIRLLPDKIVPSVKTIKLGTVVIWVNEDCKPTEIQFTNPNGMVIACDGSKSFIADPERIISQMIPCAGVESLCLVQKGEFTYEVKRGSRKLKGTIRVE
mgnify:CR=1 FL=1